MNVSAELTDGDYPYAGLNGPDARQQMHVHLGNVHVFGDPEVVVELLDEALTSAQAAADRKGVTR